ncbi:protein kinase [Candidatus Obscuribacterales bacterium]|nr:protein kinase [Candidatus Obscuribacterales bacterium]
MSADLNNDKLPSAGSGEEVFEVGQKVFGRFEVLSRLGAGGMGQVYKVRDMNLDKTLALKVLHAHTRENNSLVRFQNEAKTASRLIHPSIATVYDFGLSADGVPYMAVEFIEGETLADLMEAGPLPMNLFLSIFADVADALECAHRNGIIHRDIKPGNIMIVEREDGSFDTKVVDFGLAKNISATAGGVEQRTTTALMGTPLYMSPEQSRGEPATARSDLYALGCVMYEAIAGQPPFVGENVVETLLLHQTAKPRSLSSLLREPFSIGVLNIIDRLIAKNPEERVTSAAEVSKLLDAEIETIEGLVNQASVEDGTIHSAEKDTSALGYKMPIQFESLKSGKVAVGVVSVVLLVVAGVAVAMFVSEPKPEKTKPLRFDSFSDTLGDPELHGDKIDKTFAKLTKSGLGEDMEKGIASPLSANGGLDNGKPDLVTAGGEKWPTTLEEARQANRNEATPENRKRTVARLKSEILGGLKEVKIFVYGPLLDEDMSVFQNCQSLEDIDASSMPIGNEGLKFLSGLKNLRSLKLNGTLVTSLDQLNNVDRLQHLNLENTGVSDKTITSILKFKELEQLSLGATLVTTAGLAKLTTLPRLYDVTLTFPSKLISFDSMVKFAREHPSCKFLSSPQIFAAFSKAAEGAQKANDIRHALSLQKLMLIILEHSPAVNSKEQFRFQLMLSCGTFELKLGNKASAERYFSSAFKQSLTMPDPNFSRVCFNQLFGYYCAVNKFEGAEAVLKKWLEVRTDSIEDSLTAYDSMKVIIGFYSQEQQFEKARSWARRLMNIKTVSLVRQAAARTQYADTLRCLKEFKQSLPIFESAVSELRQMVRREPSDESCQSLATALCQYAASLFSLNEYERALLANAEGLKQMEGPYSSIFVLEGLLQERYVFLTGLNRSAEAALVKERLAKATAKREAVQREQVAEAARKAKTSN